MNHGTTKAKREAMYTRIDKHGRDLLAIFPDAQYQDPVNLCKALRRIEGQAARYALQLCNGDIDPTEEEQDVTEARMMGRLRRVLGIDAATAGHMGIFINRDPRGYALKIGDEWTVANAPHLYRDWGGYGIIAPDLSE